MLRGTVAVLPFPHPAVKVVGGNDVQTAVMADFRGQAEIPPALRHGKAPVDGVLYQVPEQGNDVKFIGRRKLRQFNMPVCVYAC